MKTCRKTSETMKIRPRSCCGDEEAENRLEIVGEVAVETKKLRRGLKQDCRRSRGEDEEADERLETRFWRSRGEDEEAKKRLETRLLEKLRRR